MVGINIHNRKMEIVGVTEVDDEFFEYLIRYRWSFTNGYVACRKLGFLHRVIWQMAGMRFEENEVIDHINFNRLNNTFQNLRQISPTISSRHQKKKAGTTSQFRGVSWSSSSQQWLAQIQVNEIGHVYLGYHDTEIQAAMFYKSAVSIVHGTDYEVDNDLPIIELPLSMQDKLRGICSAGREEGLSYFSKARQKWVAQVRFEKKQIYLGCFKDKAEADNVSKNKLKELEDRRSEVLMSSVEYIDEASAFIPWGKHQLKLRVARDHIRDLIVSKGQTWNRNGYPSFKRDRGKTITVHHWVMNKLDKKAGSHQVIDHIDGDLFNACPSNLRVCSRSENSRNVDVNRCNWNGVILRGGKWWAHILKGGHLRRWGPFLTETEAQTQFSQNQIEN